MTTTRARDGHTTLTAHEQFVELLRADEELVRAEFDAIIAAEWPSPPSVEPDRSADAARQPRDARQHREPSGADLSRRPRHPGICGRGRQRSPPAMPAPTQPTTVNKKGR